MDKENANPIVHGPVGSKRDASLFDAVPSTDVAAASAGASEAAAAGGGQIPPGYDPYEPVPYVPPPNPYDTFLEDPWSEMSGSDVGSDDEEEDVKTRQVLRRLQVGLLLRQGCLQVGMTVNVYSFRAKHRALGMHLRSMQRVEIRRAHASAQAQGSQGEQQQQVEGEPDGEHGGFNMEEAATLAAQIGCTVEELLMARDAVLPIADIPPKFVYGADLVSKERLHQLPTHMRNLHQWYLDACKENTSYIVADIPEDYYFRKEEIHIEMNELWQLFNLDALDKSLMSCYCLLKISECKSNNMFNIGFVDPDKVHHDTATMVRMMSEGVVARFLKAATAEMIRNNQKEIRCPCRRCKLTSLMDPKADMVRDHLLMRGFMDGYRWEGDEDDYEFVHGISTRNKEGGDQDVEDLGHDQDVEDPGDDHDHNVGDPGPDDEEDQDGGHHDDHEDEDDGPSSMDWVQDPYLQELLLKQTSNARAAAREKAKMDQLEVDAVTPLYEGCRPEDTRLKVTLMALEMKVKHKMTDTSFNDNMSFWHERLPKGNDINLYMGLLKEELATLWDTPANTWDAAAEEYFPMRAALLTTVHDFLGYGYVAGQVVHGFNACVRCMDDTTYRQLDRDPGSSKTVFMGHRRWLREDDPWRKRKDLFDGQDEPRRRPRTRSGEQIDELLKNWKECPPPGKKRKAPEPLLKVWKTRSVFWDLPYWKILRVPHSLDVMHITKNVCESLLGTLLNMPEKTKDGPKARYDLQSIGIREELHAGRPNDDDDDDDDDDEAEDTQSRRKGKNAKKIEYYCPPRASL
ncbi:hypothetical protein QYE76_006460 [Lolium multiflorum]|uniref:Transposase-associated domain-containing protein n=1 Tax=Lolium multiflorum TaxID=4521 RepID=A0AAD8W1Q2_LOLMU|nr:hypothetical protein QYE76_006460 [Lolium multiflorum]